MVKRLTLTLASIGALFLGVWLAMPWLLSHGARYVAAASDIELRSLDIERLGWNSSLVRLVELRTASAAGEVTAQVRGLSLDHDPFALRLSSARAAHVSLRLDLTTADTSPASASDSKTFTLPPVAIDDLALEVITDNGMSRFQGSIRFDPGRRSSSLKLRDELATITLDYRAERRQLDLRLAAIDGAAPFVQARFILREDNQVMFSGQSILGDALKWAQTGTLVPDRLRERIRDIVIEDGTLQATGTYRPTGWHGELTLAWQGLVSLDHRIDGLVEAKLEDNGDRLDLEVTQLSRLSLAPQATVDEPAFKQAAIVLEPGYHASVALVDDGIGQLEGSGPGQIRVDTDELTVTGDRPEWRADTDLDQFTVGLSRAFLEPAGVSAVSFRTSVEQAAANTWRGRATATGVRLPLPAALPTAELNAAWEVDPNQSLADGTLSMAGESIAGWKFKDSADTMTLRSSFDMSPGFVAARLAPFLGPDDGVRLSGGSFTGEVTGSWQDEPRLTANFEARNATGKYSDMSFDGLDIDLGIADLFDPLIKFTARGAGATLAGGITLSELRAAGQAKGDLVEINEARLNTLGGRVRLSPIHFKVDDEEYATQINLEGIDLTRLLKALEQESLAGDGTLEGSLPVSIGSYGLAIKNGVIFNTRPGTLRYVTPSGEATPQLNNVALQALQDFRYKALNGTVNYDENGNYSIKIRLEGHNPDLFDGYPIAFNINLNGLLDNVGRAILFGGELGMEILKRSREQRN